MPRGDALTSYDRSHRKTPTMDVFLLVTTSLSALLFLHISSAFPGPPDRMVNELARTPATVEVFSRCQGKGTCGEQ
jgi:hypothetical protein